MGGLGPRRYVAVAARLGAGGAITEGENVVVQRGLQGRANHQLVDPVGLQAVDVLEEPRRTDTRCPDFETGRDHIAIAGFQLGGRHFTD
ncbi:hypothetical protein D3C84_777290 [compost metagenome]